MITLTVVSLVSMCVGMGLIFLIAVILKAGSATENADAPLCNSSQEFLHRKPTTAVYDRPNPERKVFVECDKRQGHDRLHIGSADGTVFKWA